MRIYMVSLIMQKYLFTPLGAIIISKTNTTKGFIAFSFSVQMQFGMKITNFKKTLIFYILH